MKKFATIFLAFIMLFTLAACGEPAEDEEVVEVAGLKYRGKKGKIEAVVGKSGVWEIPGKYRIEIVGIYLEDDIKSIPKKERELKKGFDVIYKAFEVIYIVYNVTNLGYEPTGDDEKKGVVDGGTIFNNLEIPEEIGDVDKVSLRPFPFKKSDALNENVTLKPVGIPYVKEKDKTETFIITLASNFYLNEDDHFVFHAFMPDETGGYTCWFEITPQNWSEYKKS